MSDEGIPEAVEAQKTTELTENESEDGGERWRGWLRLAFAIILGILLVGDVGLYSLYQAEHSRVESMSRRLDRTEQMLMDLLASQDNREKLEAIEQKVVGLAGQIDDLKTHLQNEVPPPTPENMVSAK